MKASNFLLYKYNRERKFLTYSILYSIVSTYRTVLLSQDSLKKPKSQKNVGQMKGSRNEWGVRSTFDYHRVIKSRCKITWAHYSRKTPKESILWCTLGSSFEHKTIVVSEIDRIAGSFNQVQSSNGVTSTLVQFNFQEIFFLMTVVIR